MADGDRLAEAAQVLAYLDTTGDYGLLAREHLVADAVRRIEDALGPPTPQTPEVDAHGALAVMRDTLHGLVTPR